MSDKLIYEEFGQRVATRRKELKLTQAKLAAKVGLSRASLANIECGRQSVLLHHVYRFASALDLPKLSALLPAPSKTISEGDLNMSDDTLTVRSKQQVTDLIASALAQRGTVKAGS